MEQQSSTKSFSVNFDRKNSQNKSFRLATSDGYQSKDKEEEGVSNNLAIESIGVHFLRGSSRIAPDQDNNYENYSTFSSSSSSSSSKLWPLYHL